MYIYRNLYIQCFAKRNQQTLLEYLGSHFEENMLYI